MIIRNAIRHLRPNPTIAPHEHVLFFPPDAHLADGLWHIPVHGWIYRPTQLSRLRRTAYLLAPLWESESCSPWGSACLHCGGRIIYRRWRWICPASCGRSRRAELERLLFA